MAGVTHNLRPQSGSPIVVEEKEVVHKMKDDFNPGLCSAFITMSQLHNCVRVDEIHTQDLVLSDLRDSQLLFQTPLDQMSFVCKQSTDGTEMAGVEGFAVVPLAQEEFG